MPENPRCVRLVVIVLMNTEGQLLPGNPTLTLGYAFALRLPEATQMCLAISVQF